MKLTLRIEKDFDVKYLLAEVGVRYWEDGTVNGQVDTEGALIPCRNGDNWSPLINVETGIIENWVIGNTADVHYKCCDVGTYHLLDENKNIIKTIEGYVPTIMCPTRNGYGDYVIMKIDEDGKIIGWRVDFSDFIEE